MFNQTALIATLAWISAPVFADFAIISDKSEFVALVEDKYLQRIFIRLNISLDGQISGSAVTRPVTGDWQWKEGYFCRSLFWGQRDLGYNCQKVSVAGKKIRFTSDEGEGDHADFMLR